MNESTCPHCGQRIGIPPEAAGKSVKCPHCRNTFTANGSAGAPPAVEMPEESYAPADRHPPRRRPRDDDDDDYGHIEPHRGAAVLTLGILSLVVCGPILGPIAWIMGNTDLGKMRRGAMDRQGEGITRAGQICGMIGTILSIVAIAIYVIFFAALAGGGRL